MKPTGTPIFFYIWFAVCALLALAVLAASVLILLNPEWIGEFAGKIISGYQSVNPSTTETIPTSISTG